jgi:hypothetical protein
VQNEYLRHEKKRRIAQSKTKKKKERNVIIQKRVPKNLLVMSSTHSEPSFHLTISITPHTCAHLDPIVLFDFLLGSGFLALQQM